MPAQLHAPDDAVVLDEASLAALRQALPASMREVLITTFAQDCHSALSALMQANAAGDVQSLRKIAHRLKGLFAQFGAPHAADYAAHLSDGETSEGVTAAFFDYAEAAVQAVVKALQEPQD